MKSEAIPFEKATEHVTRHSKVGDVLALAKVRLNTLVVMTTAAGYYMTRPPVVDGVSLAWMCLGTALVAGGASALNQVSERDIDRLMDRTRQRPMAQGRMSVAEGRFFALAMAVAGTLMLWLGANAMAALVAVATLVIYASVYTPLKRRTSLSTVIGAVPGALPPLIGWAGAGGSLNGFPPWSLFLIMFVWQLPHFLAISWMCRDDYARAGLPMLSVVDRRGDIIGRQTVLWAATLIPFSQLPYLLGMATVGYALGAFVLGVALLGLAITFAVRTSAANARLLFYGSIVYLPLLLGLMAWCRASVFRTG
jgi:protoheme IX farnesyltransferase